MFRLFLLIILGSSSIWCSDFLRNYDDRFESKLYSLSDTTDQSNRKDTQEDEPVYPARSLVRSLIVPGWGQIYNKSPWWKTVLFLGVEVAALSSWRNWNQKAEDIRLDYELFADSNWTLSNWITNTTELQGKVYEELEDLGYTWDPDVHIIGTHGLDIVYASQIYSSDCLYDLDWTEEQGDNDCILPDTPEGMDEITYNTAYIPALISNGDIFVIKDRDYYENIGKYDQFVGGWEGILEGNNKYIIQFKDVGDTTEIIISSPLKENYLSQREKSNDYLNLATYAVSAVMFNHVISAFEAIWTSTRKSKNVSPIESSAILLYNKNSKYGIGGISFSIEL